MMKSPSNPMKLCPFLCNVLLQFSQHWRVVHLQLTLAAALHKFQRLYPLSGNRIVLSCNAPLATPPLCGMRKTTEVDNIEQYYQAGECCRLWTLYMKPPLFFKYSWYRQITIKAATGQTQSQSLFISPRITCVLDVPRQFELQHNRQTSIRLRISGKNSIKINSYNLQNWTKKKTDKSNGGKSV